MHKVDGANNKNKNMLCKEELINTIIFDTLDVLFFIKKIDFKCNKKNI